MAVRCRQARAPTPRGPNAPRTTYRDLVRAAKRPEEVPDVHDHIWEAVNEHLGTDARSLPQLVEQLGVMRFGHRPRVADTFAGSGQIPFEAARLGCDVYAADLSPVALHAHMGRISHRRSTGGRARPPADVPGHADQVRRGPNRRTRGRNRRKWMARQDISLLPRGSVPADGLDGAFAPKPGREQRLSASSANWCQTRAASATTSSFARELPLASCRRPNAAPCEPTAGDKTRTSSTR